MRQTNRLPARYKGTQVDLPLPKAPRFRAFGPPTKSMNSGRTAVAARSQEINLRGIENDQQRSGRRSGARAARSHRARRWTPGPMRKTEKPDVGRTKENRLEPGPH